MILEISNLNVSFKTKNGLKHVVHDFNLKIDSGEIVGVVGESGSGKSVTARTILGLINRSKMEVNGEIMLDGENLLTMSREQLRRLQGDEISMIFQEPMTSLNPVMTIGKQVEESLFIHSNMDASARRVRALEAMADVELPDPEALYDKYPHELSGGMRQRVMIASAIVRDPWLLIADEPTTALDVTVQAQILQLLRKINKAKNTAILFISHDLGVVRKLCSRVVVMKSGDIVEEGPVEQVFLNPQHEYTKLLIASRPTRVKRKRGVNHE